MEFNRREAQRTAIIRTLTFAQGEGLNLLDAVAVEDRIRLLERYYENFQNEHLALVEEHVLPADMEVQSDLAEATEQTYLEASNLLRAKFRELEGGRRPENNERNNNGPIIGQSDLRLERIAITPFTGDYGLWSEWKAMYDSLVHNVETLSDTQKFHYLKRFVDGPASQVLRGWQILGENYQAAYDSLTNIYENKYRIIIAHLEELNNMPKLSLETHEGLRSLVDTTNRVLRQLASPAIRAPVQHWDNFVVHLLMVRCPQRTLTAWESTHHQREMPTLAAFTDFLNQRAMSLIAIGQSNGNERNNKPNTNNGNNQKGKVQQQQQQQPQKGNRIQNSSSENQPRTLSCYNCGHPHQMYRCLAFQKMSVEQRKKRVRELNLCDNCLMPGHRAGQPQCRFGACKRCNRNQFHNTMLCEIPAPSVNTAQVTNGPSTSQGEASRNSTQNFQ